MQMVSMCQKDGIGIAVQAILRSKSLSQLAAAVQEVKVQSYREERLGEHFDLSPIQRLWFQLPNQGKGHFNQSFFLQVTRPVSESNARRAIEAVISRHPMLRARFDDIGYGVWQQRVTNDVLGSHRFRTHNIEKKEDATAAVTECQQSLNPFKGPLFGAELFNLRDGKQLIFAVGHHLVIDLVSWRTILQDFEDLLGNPQAKLLPTTVPFSTWCRLQAEQAPTLKLNEVLPHTNVPMGNFAYWDIPETENTYGNAISEGFELDCAATSQFLSVVQISMKADPIDVLLGTLIYSWSKVFKDREIPPIYNGMSFQIPISVSANICEIEGHGREPWNSSIELSRTVGWFTTVFPVQVAVSDSDGMIDVIRRVNEYRKQVPDNGRPYFARRCLTSVGQEYFRTHTRWEMSFNYLGQYHQLERAGALLCSVDNLAGEARGAGGMADVGFDAPRFGLFEVSAVIVQKKLRFSFTFNKYMKRQEMIREWISNSEKSLVAAIENMSQHTPESETNKFSLLGLTADHLERRFNEILPRFGLSVEVLEDAYPCTGIQDGILLSRSRDPGYYSAAVSYEVRCSNGRADVQRLANAWQLVVRRHPVLRTIFVESFSKADAIYDQLVLKDHKANIVHLAANSNAEATQLLESRRLDDFDDGRTPPHRFTIVETKASTVFCMLEISHAIMDGESINVLFCDLTNAYDQRLIDQLTPNFGEYVQYLRKMDIASGIQFWKNYLREAEPTRFPPLKDCNRKIQRQLRSIRFDSDSVNPQRVRDFCSDNSVTMTNVFHAAWAVTLSYYAGSEDVCFGYLMSGRDAATEGIDNMVGPLINTLTCRVKLSKSQTLKNILEDIQQDYVDSFEHRMVPLGLVQNALELHGSALFNSVLSYHRVKSNRRTGGQETLTFLENGPYYDPTEYPVGINIEVSDSAVALDLEYWTDYISDAHAQNVASTFAHCLENLLGHSDRALGELTRTSSKHIQQILGWNKTSPEIIHDCLHNVFSKQVRLQPDALAIRAFDGNFTYAELESYSDRLAHYLVELGIGPEIYVPCCFDKSSFTVVAMMGVLKAGGACVALDANHPKEALKTRILDTRASFVLTTACRAELFEDLVPNVVCVSKKLFSQISNFAKPVTSSVRPENPAFVIFTSGSTGKPKGVVLEHRSVVTSIFAHGPKLGIGPGTRFLQFASYPFDVSLEEIFTTLTRGGCCCIPSEEQRMSNIVGAINELEANFIDLTPTVASMIDPDAVPSIKGMAMGGEPLTKAVIEKWCRRVRLHGFYGPSEASSKILFLISKKRNFLTKTNS
jgi:non-ribosomal peptide synthase protein (TIGR01720 family)